MQVELAWVFGVDDVDVVVVESKARAKQRLKVGHDQRQVDEIDVGSSPFEQGGRGPGGVAFVSKDRAIRS